MMFNTSGYVTLLCPENSWIRNQLICNTKRIFAIDKFSSVLSVGARARAWKQL